MALEAKIGILRDRLVVGGVEYPLRREGGGWVSVPTIGERPGGRVRYDAVHDRIHVEGVGDSALLPFRWRRTLFRFGGREYRVGPMAWGHVMVSRADHPVATGRLTANGVRLGYVAPELQPISHELVVGLAYRAIALWLASTAGRASR